MDPRLLIAILCFALVIFLIMIISGLKKKPEVEEVDDEEDEEESDHVVSTYATRDRCICGGKVIAKVYSSGEIEKQCIECETICY